MALTDISLEPLFNSRTSVVVGYQISDQDMGATSYYGYVNKDGEWYIMKSVVSAAVTNYTYTKGSSGYAANWTARAGLSYDNFAAIF